MQEYARSTSVTMVWFIPQSGIGYSSGQNGAQGAYLQHQHIGFMYMSQNGQMCGLVLVKTFRPWTSMQESSGRRRGLPNYGSRASASVTSACGAACPASAWRQTHQQEVRAGTEVRLRLRDDGVAEEGGAVGKPKREGTRGRQSGDI